MPVRLLIIACLLTAPQAFAEGEWGEPVVLSEAAEAWQGVLPMEGSDNVEMDASGRVWRLLPKMGGGAVPATWEDGRWRIAELGQNDARVDLRGLRSGPHGSVYCLWRRGVMELRGLRVRHTPPPQPATGQAHFFEDRLGEVWGFFPMSPSHTIVAGSQDEGRWLFSLPMSQSGALLLYSAASGENPKVLRDGAGRLWMGIMTLNETAGGFTEMLAGILPEGAAPPDFGAAGTEPAIPMALLGRSGEMAVFSPPSLRGAQSPNFSVRAHFRDKDTLWVVAEGRALWEVALNTLKSRLLSPPEESFLDNYPNPRLNISAILPLGDRVLAAAEDGVWAVTGTAWRKLAPGKASGLFPAEGGAWAAFQIPPGDTAPPLVFIPEGDGAARAVPLDRGGAIRSADKAWLGPAGELVLHDGTTQRVRVVDATEQLELLAAAGDPPAPLPGVRVFNTALNPLSTPDGRVIILAKDPAQQLSLHVWDGHAWRDTPLSLGGDYWNPSNLDNVRLALADTGGIWVYDPGQHGGTAFAAPGRGENTIAFCRGMVVDAAGGVEPFASVQEMLEDPAKRPGAFIAPEGAPLICPDGRVAYRLGRILYCLDGGTWRRHDLARLGAAVQGGEHLPLYVDDEGRICVEKGGKRHGLAPGATAFEPVPGPPLHAAQTPAPPPPQRWGGMQPAMPGQPFQDGAGAENGSGAKGVTDELGMTWSVVEGALRCAAHDVEAVPVPGVDGSPFFRWTTLERVTRGPRGELFAHAAAGPVIFVPRGTAPPQTRATATLQEDGRAALRFTTEASGLRHAWRVDGGPWSATDLAGAVTEPLTPERHRVEVYAFDNRLNAAPEPVRLEVGEDTPPTPEALAALLLQEGGERQTWALKRLEALGAAGLAAVEQRLLVTVDDGDRWRLEAARQLLEDALAPKAEEKKTTGGSGRVTY